LAALRRERAVTQAILVEGRHRVRVHEPSRVPPPGFEPAAPTLEDAYLVMMRTDGANGAAEPAGAAAAAAARAS